MNDGGPAFPLKNYSKEAGPDTAGFTATDAVGNLFWVNSGAPGMSLRDYFVAASGEEAWGIYLRLYSDESDIFSLKLILNEGEKHPGEA